MNAELHQRFILAEYCDADLFHGWHLYERDRNDGSPNDDGWGWLRRGDLRLQFDIAPLLPSLPQPVNVRDTFDDIAWHNRFVAAFVQQFPHGVIVTKREREYLAITDAKERG